VMFRVCWLYIPSVFVVCEKAFAEVSVRRVVCRAVFRREREGDECERYMSNLSRDRSMVLLMVRWMSDRRGFDKQT